jgi:hypothetical protein
MFMILRNIVQIPSPLPDRLAAHLANLPAIHTLCGVASGHRFDLTSD